jgi:NDP-sugar pyrophosphorylase family protein
MSLLRTFDYWDTFEPKSAVWIPCAGLGERMRPYTYLRAKACLPINDITKIPIWQNILTHCAFYFKPRPDAFILTIHYRPDDFKEILKNSDLNAITFQTEVIHGTACDFDLLRLYFPTVSTWFMALGDQVFRGDCLKDFNAFDNAVLVGDPDNKPSGIFHFKSGCQWFREKSEDTTQYRWRGVLKMNTEKLRKPLPEPFLCTKSERHRLHGKSFQETFMEAIIGNYGWFEPISVEEQEIVSLGERWEYEKYIGRSQQGILELLRPGATNGNKISSPS